MDDNLTFANSKRIPINVLDLKTNNQPILIEPLQIMARKNDLKLHLNMFDTEEHDKPVLVLIHGNSTSMRIFHEQIQHFLDRFRVIAIDLPGHGGSYKLEDMDLSQREQEILGAELYSLSGMIAAVNAGLQAKAVENAHFVCWSLGGHIAYGLANDNPNLAASITTMGSPPVRFSKKGLEEGFLPWFSDTLVNKWVSEPVRHSYEDNLEIANEFNLPKQTAQYFAEDTTITDPAIRKFLFHALHEGDDPKYMATEVDAHHFVNQTSIPLCLISGDLDTGINSKYIASFDGKLAHPASRVHIIKDGNHAPFATHPKECRKMILDFIDAALNSSKKASGIAA